MRRANPWLNSKRRYASNYAPELKTEMSRKQQTPLLVALLLLSCAACQRRATVTQQTPPATTVTEQQSAAGGVTPAPEVKYFRGSIGSALGLQMKLIREGQKLIG